MKKLSELMIELGFRPDGSDEVKKAFILNLVRQAQQSPQQRDATKIEPIQTENQQLSLFDKKAS